MEIDDDGIDNDGDGEVDEVNTGTHPTYGSLDPDDADSDDTAISSISASSAGTILVRYADDSVFSYDVFTGFTKSKEVKVQQYKSKSYYLVLHPNGKNLKLVNALNGQVVDSQKITKHTFGKNSLKTLDVRKDGSTEAVITSKNNKTKGKKNQVRVTVVKVNTATESLTKKGSVKFKSKKAVVGKTKAVKKQVRVRKKNGKVAEKLRTTKAYKLNLVEDTE